MPNEAQTWRQRIAALTAKAEFHEPAAAVALAAAEELLGLRLPPELVSLLQESDGVVGEYGLRLLWSIEQIKEENLKFRKSLDFRQIYMPFDCLLFFSDAGNGDQFAYVVLECQIRRDDIFVWNHEDDSRTWAAPSLSVFYNWWLSGKLKI
jgi:hypothetical protein